MPLVEHRIFAERRFPSLLQTLIGGAPIRTTFRFDVCALLLGSALAHQACLLATDVVRLDAALVLKGHGLVAQARKRGATLPHQAFLPIRAPMLKIYV